MSTSILEPYQPEPLEPGQIRLLFIQKKQSSDELVCGIYHTEPSNVTYTAISYSWDAASEENNAVDVPLIDVYGLKLEDGRVALAFTLEPRRSLRINESIRKMLISVGEVEEDDAPNGDGNDIDFNAFWIDQICINQLDLTEKAEHVKRMHQVYAQAERTIIYLGEPSEDTHYAFGVAYTFAFLDKLEEDEIPFADKNWLHNATPPVKDVD